MIKQSFLIGAKESWLLCGIPSASKLMQLAELLFSKFASHPPCNERVKVDPQEVERINECSPCAADVEQAEPVEFDCVSPCKMSVCLLGSSLTLHIKIKT